MGERGLSGRTALVTGVSRRRGIGFAVAGRLAAMGASLVVHHHAPHDADQPWGTDDLPALLDDLRSRLTGEAMLTDLGLDLAEPDAGERLVRDAVAAAGHLDVLVCNHAQSGQDGPLAETTAQTLDRHFAVNTRSTVLATKAFAAQHDGRPGGRVIWMTSGQAHGGMGGEIAYVASKAALAGLTRSVAETLAEQVIVLNTVNPGPVNTGYLDGPLVSSDGDRIRALFPAGRVGEPDDPARLIGWLVSDEGVWVAGQVLDSEGGFRR